MSALGSAERELELVRFLHSAEPWQRSARLLLARFGLLAIRAAQKHGYIERHGEHKHWGRRDDHYTLTQTGKVAASVARLLAAE